MLSEWQKNVDKYIPPQLSGYDFICRVPVYIPVQEIVLTVWERRVQVLSFVQECVLTAIRIGSKSLPDLADQFGLPESIMLQIVSQLDSEQLGAVSCGDIVLTDLGKKVLESQKKVKTLRSQLSRISVNQITGEVSDTPLLGTYREPPRGQAYLLEKYPLNLEFLRSQFDTLAVIYRESRLANVVFQSTAESAELYRILDISYHTLSYQREFCFVYLNQADRSLAFHFQSGIQAYADVLAEQLNCRHLGAWNLFSPPNRPCAASPEEEQLPHDLIAAFKLRGVQSDWADLLEAAYYADRPLLDGELQDILYHCAAFKAPRIFIQAPFLVELLNDDILRTIFSAHTKEVIVRYNRNDYQADFILGRMGKLRKDCVLTTVPSEDISSVKFCFGTACFIQGQYAAKETVYKRRLYKLCAEITFNSAQIDSLWNDLLEIGSEAPSKS